MKKPKTWLSYGEYFEKKMRQEHLAKTPFQISRTEIQSAVRDFQKQGGQIKKLPYDQIHEDTQKWIFQLDLL